MGNSKLFYSLLEMCDYVNLSMSFYFLLYHTDLPERI